MASARLMICPFCGHTQRPGERCQDCGADFAPAARKDLIDSMGAWFVRDEERPFRPGLSYPAIVDLARRGEIRKYTILRGPTTRQLWTVARHVPGIAHLLGYCHACDGPVTASDPGCRHCGATFGVHDDRNTLGLPAPSAAAERMVSRSAGFTPVAGNGVAGGRAEAVGDQRDGEAGPISAFATDEELFGPGRAPAAPRRVVETAPTAAGAALAAGTLAREAVERSRRNAARRRRRIVVLLGVLLAAALVAVLWSIAAGRSGLFPGAGDGGDAAALRTGGDVGGGRSDGDVRSGGADAGMRKATDPTGKPTGVAGHDAAATAGELFRALDALEALGAGGSASIESRRERAAELVRLLERAASMPGFDPATMESLRGRLDAARAKIELDAVLPDS